MKIADHIENAEPVFEGAYMYKAVKADGMFTAVHVFPFQLTQDHIVFFNKQVEQLGEAYIEYRTAIPRVLSYGYTQNGSFPFIETEWINGYRLDQIIKNRKALPISSIINIAEEVSRTMAQCHKLGVVHGDINTKNIIWDETGKRYIITGFRFGLEPPKNHNLSSRAVAIIVPGQKHTPKLELDDVQDIGRMLWQLLTGKIHWQPGDDLNELYFQHVPDEWSQEAPNNERNIPAWFITCINKALGIAKDKNFEDAVQLYSFILSHHKTPFQKKDWYRSKPQSFNIEPNAGSRKVSLFKWSKREWPQNLKKKAKQLRFVFDRNIGAGLIIAALLLGFSIYAQKKQNRKDDVTQTQTPPMFNTTGPVTNNTQKKEVPAKKPNADTSQPKARSNTASVQKKPVVIPTTDSMPSPDKTSTGSDLGSYKVRSKAYFHNEPDEKTKRNAFIVHWNNAVLHPLKEEGDFVYIVFTNHLGQTSKGWLRKQDLIKQ